MELTKSELGKKYPLLEKNLIYQYLDSHLINQTVLCETTNNVAFLTITAAGKQTYENAKQSRDKLSRKRQLEDELLASTVNNNKQTPRWAAVAGIMAVTAAFIAFLDYKKSNESILPALLRIDSTLQTNRQKENMNLQEMKNEIDSLHRLVDSLSKKP